MDTASSTRYTSHHLPPSRTQWIRYRFLLQVMNYQFHFSREVMYDKDIMILQVLYVTILSYTLVIQALESARA